MTFDNEDHLQVRLVDMYFDYILYIMLKAPFANWNGFPDFRFIFVCLCGGPM